MLCPKCGKKVATIKEHMIGHLARGKMTDVYDCDYYNKQKVKKCGLSKK